MTGEASPPIFGTETEFGITVRNQPDFNPVLGSSLVINSYAGARARIQWSYEAESPGRDARGFGFEPAPSADFESTLVNVVLTNGARLYVDHAHPEYSSPECADARQAALYDKAGEVVLARAARRADDALGPGERMLIHKNNSDGKGNSYGAHENYLVPRSVPFADLVEHLTPFFVSRQIFTGAGKVGSENGRPLVSYQITQRADFFEEEVGLETTLKRPIINTRDEPHADPNRYRRLHVIIGDATRSEYQTFLKLATTGLVLGAITAGRAGSARSLARPVDAVWQVSHDVSLSRRLPLDGGSHLSALELQWEFLDMAARHAAAEGASPTEQLALTEWEQILNTLATDPMRAADTLDWVAKLQLIDQFRERDGLAWDDPKLRLIDLQYHDVDPQRGLYQRLVDRGAVRRLFDDAEIEAAVGAPPDETRAYFRGRCIEKYGPAIVAANWDSLVFDVGEAALKRVPMMDPRRGTRSTVGDLIAGSETAADLVHALGGPHG